MWALIQRNPALRRIVLYQLLAALQAGTFGLLFNLYLLALGHKEDLIGFVAGASTLTLSFTALTAGRFARRWGLRRTLMGGFALASLASLGQALSSGALPIIAFAILAGAGYAMTQSLQMPLLAEHIAANDRDGGGVSLGHRDALNDWGHVDWGFLPELLGAGGLSVIARDRIALVLAVAIGLLGFIPISRLDRGGVGPPQAFSAAIGAAQSDETSVQVRRTIQRYAIATALISVGAGAFLPFVNVYLARLGARPGEIGGLLSGVGVTGAVLGLLAPTLGRRLGRERLSVLCRTLPIVPAAVLLALPGIPFVVLTYATRQIGAGMTWPIEASILNDRVHPRARPGAFGLRTAAWNLAWAGSSAVSGQLIVRGGYQWPLVMLMASTALGGVMLSLVLRPTADEVAKREGAKS